MRNRGKIYWEWANSALHSRNYDERLPCGTLINIQARLSLENVTQLFLGIYGKKGVLLLEEVHPDCSGCLLYTSPSPRDLSTSRMPSSA